VLHVHWREVLGWRNRYMWLIAGESFASLLWILMLVASLLITLLAITFGGTDDVFGFALAWGIAISVVALIQLLVALAIQRRYEPTNLRALLVGAVYPIAYWTVSAAATVHSQAIALLRGPLEQRVVWNIPRETLEATGAEIHGEREADDT
jgi:biofilm PGA synthesis N-glycosyltransferase PgaC